MLDRPLHYIIIITSDKVFLPWNYSRSKKQPVTKLQWTGPELKLKHASFKVDQNFTHHWNFSSAKLKLTINPARGDSSKCDCDRVCTVGYFSDCQGRDGISAHPQHLNTLSLLFIEPPENFSSPGLIVLASPWQRYLLDILQSRPDINMEMFSFSAWNGAMLCSQVCPVQLKGVRRHCSKNINILFRRVFVCWPSSSLRFASCEWESEGVRERSLLKFGRETRTTEWGGPGEVKSEMKSRRTWGGSWPGSVPIKDIHQHIRRV